MLSGLALVFITVPFAAFALTRSSAPDPQPETAGAPGLAPADITRTGTQAPEPSETEAPTEAPTEAQTEPETQRAPYTYIASMDWGAEDAYLLAKIAMAEAEGEDTEGKALVILTVLNRVWAPQFPGTIEEVITQPGAFTSYWDGRWDRVEPNEDCYNALHKVQVEHWDESQGALYFERSTAEDTWHSRNLVKLFDHGNHTFYTEKEVGTN